MLKKNILKLRKAFLPGLLEVPLNSVYRCLLDSAGREWALRWCSSFQPAMDPAAGLQNPNVCSFPVTKARGVQMHTATMQMSEADWDESHSRSQRAQSAWEQYPISKEFSSKNSVPNGHNSFQKLTGWRQVCSAAFFFTELPFVRISNIPIQPLSLPIIPLTSSSSYITAKLSSSPK